MMAFRNEQIRFRPSRRPKPNRSESGHKVGWMGWIALQTPAIIGPESQNATHTMQVHVYIVLVLVI